MSHRAARIPGRNMRSHLGDENSSNELSLAAAILKVRSVDGRETD